MMMHVRQLQIVDPTSCSGKSSTTYKSLKRIDLGFFNNNNNKKKVVLSKKVAAAEKDRGKLLIGLDLSRDNEEAVSHFEVCLMGEPAHSCVWQHLLHKRCQLQPSLKIEVDRRDKGKYYAPATA